MMIDQDNWLDHGWVDTREVADHYGVCLATVRRWITRDGLPADRSCRYWKLHMPSVERWHKQGNTHAD